MLNVFVEFRFQLFNIKTLFYLRLRISADMIEDLKTRNVILTLLHSLEAIRCLKILEYLSPKRCSLPRVLKCLLISLSFYWLVNNFNGQ